MADGVTLDVGLPCMAGHDGWLWTVQFTYNLVDIPKLWENNMEFEIIEGLRSKVV